MAQITIVSNRLPVSAKKEDGQLVFYPSVGGLATGLSSYVEDRNNIWIGWPGLSSDDLSEEEITTISTELAKYNCIPVFLSKQQINDFYNGYSNSVLWPLCHDLKVSRTDHYERWWNSYQEVNQIFADIITGATRVSSTIWIHDYHLLMVPAILRDKRKKGHIGFFLHIPFPSYKTLSKLKEAKNIIEGVLGADLIGFHTQGYVDNFLESCRELLSVKVGDSQLVFNNRIIRTTAFPMGIDYEKYTKAGKTKAVRDAVKKYRKKYRGRKVIASVDRLDPSKGLVERLEAYREFLTKNPKVQGRVIFSMVVSPSRTEVKAYKNLDVRLKKMIEEIDDEFSTKSWHPVDYIEGLPFEEVTALYRVADVAFIAPLHDGMNLVAKEFIASKRNSGVLILSETAGAAQELQDALLVNPNNPADVVKALERSLTMPRRELKRRLRRMQRYLSTHTVQTWANSFITALNQPIINGNQITRTITNDILKKIRNNYNEASKRLLLLDYDGTLMPLVNNFENSKPTEEVKDILKKLKNDKNNDVVVVSGRSRDDLEKWIPDLSINLVAEHGAYIRKAGHSKWISLSKSEVRWKKAVRPILERYAHKTPNAVVEEKSHSLVWHYRQSPPYYAGKYSVVIKRVLKPFVDQHELEVFSGNKILEIRDPRLNKGGAVKQWLIKGYDFILAIGDDYTDEDMFQIMPPGSYSIKIGAGRTKAQFRTTYKEVHKLLYKLMQ